MCTMATVVCTKFIDYSGSHNEEHGEIFHKLFNGPTFRVKVVKDIAGVQLFGALKVL